MGLLNRIGRLGGSNNSTRRGLRRDERPAAWRACRFELMEPRRLLAVDVVPIQIGAVYHEDATGEDLGGGDRFQVAFSGGAPGTQLTELVVETDKEIDGLTIGDCFFDIDATQQGAFGYVPFSGVSSTGIQFFSETVEDGGTVLTLAFAGFEAGDTFGFSIDVDEQGFLGPNAVAEGNEFEGSRLTATFVADHFLAATGTSIFRDAYDVELAASGLDLPPDDYTTPPQEPQPIQTAGAFIAIEQEPEPITLAGTVFEDNDLDLVQDNSVVDPGIANVTLTLHKLADGQYASTGQITQTDAYGDYCFAGLLPGTYRVIEVQPGGYLDVGAVAGTVGGATRGATSGPNIITDVVLQGGEDSIDNDFAEVRPAAISGHVYHDANNNGVRDSGEDPISGVTIFLEQTGAGAQSGGGLITFGPAGVLDTTTDADGAWSFDDLVPGEYSVEEVHPTAYIDGLDAAGTAGGTAYNPGDLIDGVVLNPGVTGKNYDFGELRPASIRGHVYAELNGNCHWEAGEPYLAGVAIHLLDASGNRIQSTVTGAKGQYSFENLAPGTYGVEEIQPADYYDACDLVGTAGGDNSVNDKITSVDLPSGTNAVDYIFVEVVGATISGYVFQDGPDVQLGFGAEQPDVATIRDGRFTADDTPLAGVVLQLGDDIGIPVLGADGKPIITTTNVHGYYEFEKLPPGTYTILEVQPEGFVDGIDTAGSEGGIAVNPSDNVSPMILSQLAVDPKDDAIIRINLSVADTAVSYNFSEVRFVRQPYFPDPDPDPDPRTPKVPSPPPLPEPAAYPVPYAQPYESPPLGYGGSGLPTGATWHLSVINGGQPRGAQAGTSEFITISNPHFNPASWIGTRMDRAVWKILVSQDMPEEQCRFGFPGAMPITGDFNGDGHDEVGVFIDGQWFIDLNGNGRWDDGDLWAKLGSEGDLPVTGDWDGDGKTDIGIFGTAWVGDPRAIAVEPGLPDSQNAPSGRYKNIPPDDEDATGGVRTMKRTAEGRLRSDIIDHVFHFGTAGDRPVAGDWNGDGVATIGVFRGGVWFLDVDGDGRWSTPDLYVEYGGRDDLPVVGDFNNDGLDDIGVYRAGKWLLDSNANHQLDAQDKVFELGGPYHQPVVGDFDGDGTVEFGVYDTGPSVNQQVSQ